MKVALTGATGFIGRHIVQHLTDQGHIYRCWYRPGSNRVASRGQPRFSVFSASATSSVSLSASAPDFLRLA